MLPPSHYSMAVVTACLVSTACASPGHQPSTTMPQATRSGPTCDSLITRIMLNPDSFPNRIPRSLQHILLPEPPATLIDKPIGLKMNVDESGKVDPGSVVISAGVDSAYAKRVYDRVVHFRFAPAVVDGCAVPSVFDVSVTVGHMRPVTEP